MSDIIFYGKLNEHSSIQLQQPVGLQNIFPNAGNTYQPYRLSEFQPPSNTFNTFNYPSTTVGLQNTSITHQNLNATEQTIAYPQTAMNTVNTSDQPVQTGCDDLNAFIRFNK